MVVECQGFEPRSVGLQPSVLPLTLALQMFGHGLCIRGTTCAPVRVDLPAYDRYETYGAILTCTAALGVGPRSVVYPCPCYLTSRYPTHNRNKCQSGTRNHPAPVKGPNPPLQLSPDQGAGMQLISPTDNGEYSIVYTLCQGKNVIIGQGIKSIKTHWLTLLGAGLSVTNRTLTVTRE